MPRFSWPEPDLEGLLSDWNGSDRENLVSCLSAFELDEIEDRLTPSSGEDPQDFHHERAELLREQKLLLEHHGRATRQRRKLEQRAESLATLVRRAHDQRFQLCAALKALGGRPRDVSGQPSVALASALSPRQPPPLSGSFGLSARRSSTASPAAGKTCSASPPGRPKSRRRPKGAPPPPESSDEPEAELFDSESRDEGFTSALPHHKAHGKTLPSPPSPRKGPPSPRKGALPPPPSPRKEEKMDSKPDAWVSPMKKLGSLPVPPDSLKAAATCAATKCGFTGQRLPVPEALPCTLPPCLLESAVTCTADEGHLAAHRPEVPLFLGFGAGGSAGSVPPPLAFASKVFSEKSDHSSNSCPSLASVSTGVSTRSESHPGTSSSYSAPSHHGPATPPRGSTSERSKHMSTSERSHSLASAATSAMHSPNSRLRWPEPSVTPQRSEDRARSAPSVSSTSSVSRQTTGDSAASGMPAASGRSSLAGRSIPTWPCSWLKEEEERRDAQEERQEVCDRLPGNNIIAGAAAKQKSTDIRRAAAPTATSVSTGGRGSTTPLSTPMAPRLSTAVSPPPSPVLSGCRNIRAVGSPPPSPSASGSTFRNTRPVGSPPPSPKGSAPPNSRASLLASPKNSAPPSVTRRVSVGSTGSPGVTGRKSLGSSSYSGSPGRASIGSPMRAGGSSASVGHHPQARANSAARTVGSQRQASPAASSPSPRTAARQRRYDRENWARRGVGGVSPPPRVLGAASDPAPGNSEPQGGSLHVIVRCRPCLSAQPMARTPVRAVRVTNSTTLEVCETPGTLVRQFAVDAAFGEDAKTGNVFSAIRNLARAAAGGASAAVVAYGPTGSGKTFTMYGDARDPGIVPRAAAELLSCSGGQPIQLSMIELHNDCLVDLLATPGQPAPPLEVRGGSGGAMATIEGAREFEGSSVSSLLVAIQSGLGRRQVAATNVNAASSRSHLIVVFGLGSTGGRLTLVDLAGVERVKRSGAQGGVLREAQSINRSLQSIGDVVDALRKGASHIPVRNSRLSRLISGALGGGADTAVVVCVASEAENRDEAVAALCFAERVRRIPIAGAVPSETGSTTSHTTVESRRLSSARHTPLLG